MIFQLGCYSEWGLMDVWLAGLNGNVANLARTLAEVDNEMINYMFIHVQPFNLVIILWTEKVLWAQLAVEVILC